MYCEKCGKKLEDDFTFCPACGHLVNYQSKEKKPSPSPGYSNLVDPNSNSTYKETNILSILAIIFSIVPLVGWILGVMGLLKAKKINDSGKTLAIVSLIFSTAFFVMWILAFKNLDYYGYDYFEGELNQAAYLLFNILK